MQDLARLDLPIAPYLPEIERLLLERGSLVLSASPGAGKTSLAPLFLASGGRLGGKILCLEPRRIACVQAAARAAELLGEEVGGQVGYRVRLETRTSPRARLEFVTEGILVRMIQDDPGLEGIALLVFDEFHERSVQADLGLALALESRALRPDLRLLLMSATLDTERLASFLGAPLLEVPGRAYPVETRHEALAGADRASGGTGGRGAQAGAGGAGAGRGGLESGIASLARRLAGEAEGDVLVFLPGAGEIARTARELEGSPFEVLSLHGSLPLEAQRRVLLPAPGAGKRVILATSVAETSLTVPRVAAVLDSGLARLQRFQPRTGLNRLVTEREARDRAEQRRGRAGRLGPGLCLRAWAASESLPERTEAEILRAELSSLVLEAALWGARSPGDLPWIDEPPAAAWEAARELLAELGALDSGGRITEFGRAAAGLGAEPRLAALVLRGAEAGRLREAAALAALLGERLPAEDGEGDLGERLARLARGEPAYARIREVAGELARQAERLAPRSPRPGPSAARRPGPADSARSDAGRGAASRPAAGPSAGYGALLARAFPDRVARRAERRVSARGPEASFRIPGGRLLRARGALAEADWIVAAEVDAGGAGGSLAARPGAADEGTVFSGAVLAEEEALEALASLIEDKVELEWEGLSCRARRRRRAGSILLSETPLGPPSPEAAGLALAARVAAEGLRILPWEEGGGASGAGSAGAFLARARWYLAAKSGAAARRGAAGRGGAAAEPGSLDAAARGSQDGEAWPDLSDETLAAEAGRWLAPFVQGGTGPVISGGALRRALEALFPYRLRAELDREAPERLGLPSGSSRPVLYGEGPAPVVEARVQEFYGLAEHPRIAGRPVTLRLLTPAGRPLQVTADLPGFWRGSWAEARKELRGRYPKHDWPEDPAAAAPSARGFKKKPPAP